MHGIQRETRSQQGNTAHTDVCNVVVRYADGRILTFIPEAGRPNFSEDDMLQLAITLDAASSVAEWAEVGRPPGPQSEG
jgi:hypothetical protein